MSDDPADTIAAAQRAVVLLVRADDAAGVRIAQGLRRWLAGETWESALDLAPDWRRRLHGASRDAALVAIVNRNPGLDDRAVARRIVAGVMRMARTRLPRPDGEAGYFHDLARLKCGLSERQWRRLVRGHREPRNGHDDGAPSIPNQEY